MADAATDNMRIWDQVSKTDPAHTKKVNQRGGFTAISAHYQIMRATEVFGPLGEGWGYDVAAPIWHEALVIVPVTLWHGDRSQTFGPIYGGAEWRSDKGRLDSDAPKKATTDGLTKALSQLGFNADVFLGRFDDNKYVEQMAREFSGEETITDEQRHDLIGLLEASKADVKGFCTFYKINALPGLPASKFDHARQSLLRKLEKAK